MKIGDILSRARYAPALQADTADNVIAELAGLAAGAGVDPETVRAALAERERLGSTALSDGVAIPHGKLRGLADVLVVVGLHREGVRFGAVDNGDTHLFVTLLAPDNDPAYHLKVLARLARLLKDSHCRNRLLAARTAEEMSAAFVDADTRIA